MVKNTGGGNRAKKFARKKLTNDAGYKKLRVPVEEGEKFAVVNKLYGGAELSVICIDGIERRCIMRKKFRGRSKRDNHVKTGTWVLVGLREYQKVHNTTKGKQKLEVCDLLEVYKESEVNEIKETLDIDFAKLMTEEEQVSHDNIKFVDDATFQLEQTIQQNNYETVKMDTNEILIDADDI